MASVEAICEFAASGDLVRIARVHGVDLSLGEELIRAEMARFESPDLPLELLQGLRRIPAQVHRPAFGQLLLDSEGYLWAPGYLGATEAHLPLRTMIISPTGEWLGWVDLPPAFRPLSIGPDYVAGVSRDTLGVEDVRILSLSRNPPSVP